MDGLNLRVHGVDVDAGLVSRAKEQHETEEDNEKSSRVTFQHLDVMADNAESRLRDFLDARGKKKFDAIFVFSVTMWIHLNHGDEGLERFFGLISSISDLVLLEPQPWKCYRAAAKRMRKLGRPNFEHLATLERDIDGAGTKVEEHLLEMCKKRGLETAERFEETHWKRKLVLLKKKT